MRWLLRCNAPTNLDFDIDPAAFAAAGDPRTRLVAVSSVQYASGVRVDLAALGLLDAGSNLITINSGSSANVTYDGLVDTFTGLPAQYRQNARGLMNSTSFGQILKLKDSVNRPILLPNEIPGNLWTKPMLFSEFMPTPAASSAPTSSAATSRISTADPKTSAFAASSRTNSACPGKSSSDASWPPADAPSYDRSV